MIWHPELVKGEQQFLSALTTGVHTLYLGSRTTWRHTLQSDPSSPPVQKAIHLWTVFRDGFNGFTRAAELLFVTGKNGCGLGYRELKLFLQCQKIQTELYCTGQTEPLLHHEYWTVTPIYTSKGQNFWFLIFYRVSIL